MRRIGLPTLFIFLCFVSTGWREAQAQTHPRTPIITFDAPGAGTSARQGTIPEQNTLLGLIAGFYIDQNGVNHGFVRDRRGKITAVDVPGAAYTVVYGILDDGTVVGTYINPTGGNHGFVGPLNGKFTTIDVPGAGPIGTLAAAINPAGTISGLYWDAIGTMHGFVRSPEGTITSFDPPGSVSTSADTLGIDLEGAIAGPYFDSNNTQHGYLRAPDGTITTIDAPGAGTGPGQGTAASMISPRGRDPWSTHRCEQCPSRLFAVSRWHFHHV